jgi:hypothetical protein
MGPLARGACDGGFRTLETTRVLKAGASLAEPIPLKDSLNILSLIMIAGDRNDGWAPLWSLSKDSRRAEAHS